MRAAKLKACCARGRLESGTYCGSLSTFGKDVRRRSDRAPPLQARLVNEVSDMPGKVR